MNTESMNPVKRATPGVYVKIVNARNELLVGKITAPGDICEVETAQGAIIDVARNQLFKATKAEFERGYADEVHAAEVEAGNIEDDFEDSIEEDLSDVEAELAEDEAEAGNEIVKRHYQLEYIARSGNRDCDDELAQHLRGVDLDQVYSMAEDILEINEEDLRAKYGHLNQGLQRMNLGNRIRAAVKKRGEAENAEL